MCNFGSNIVRVLVKKYMVPGIGINGLINMKHASYKSLKEDKKRKPTGAKIVFIPALARESSPERVVDLF